MPRPTQTLLDRQVSRVGRRLFVQQLLNRLVVCWTAALAGSVVWFLLQPVVLGALSPERVGNAGHWLHWAVTGVLVALAMTVALVQAVRRSPSRLDAALTLDQRFGLCERVTTSLALSEPEKATPAGLALLGDVQQKLESVHVGERFPVRLNRWSALVPSAAGVLAVVALFYDPVPRFALGETDPKAPVSAAAAAEIDRKVEELVKKLPRNNPKPEDRPKSEELQQLEARLEEILKQPRDTQEKLREQAKAVSSLEEELKKKEKEDAEKVRDLQDQFRQLDQLRRKEKDKSKDKDGPAKDLEDALAKGDLNKAKDEADRLSKKMKENKLEPKDKDELQKDLHELKDKLERLSREKQQEDEQKRKEQEDKLKQMQRDGKISEEQLERELDKLKKQAESKDKQEMKELAEKLERCQQCMKDGDTEGAAQAMQEAADQLEKMDNRERDLEDLQGELQRLQDLRESMCKECEGGGRRSQDGDAESLTRNQNRNSKPGSGRNSGGPGQGRRPEAKSGDTNTVDEKQKGRFDPSGQKTYAGTAEGKGFNKKQPGPELDGEIKQASQEAPEAIEAQRIPKAARDMAKGYFRNLGGQQTGPNPPPKQP